MDQTQHIKYLLDKYLSGDFTHGEFQELTDLFELSAPEILNEVIDDQMEKNAVAHNDPTVMDIVSEIDRNLLHKIRRPATVSKMMPLLRIAASFLIIVGIGIFLYLYQFSNKQGDLANDISPGKNGATLRLSDGRTIKLADAKSGLLASEHGASIVKGADGTISYGPSQANGERLLNTLSTSEGETYAISLPDGSRVWLNAASSISYPSSFSGQQNREVSLSGEAYFEVAKDKSHPFIVATDKQRVEVLGTHFNINGYPGEKAVLTTLLEGSVKVNYSENPMQNKQSVLLLPGQQSMLGAGGISVRSVHVDDAVAWKNGYFMFDSEPLGSVMSRISRWYSVRIQYRDESVKKELFFGTISKFEDISGVLKMLQGTGVVEFEIKENIIIVSKKD